MHYTKVYATTSLTNKADKQGRSIIMYREFLKEYVVFHIELDMFAVLKIHACIDQLIHGATSLYWLLSLSYDYLLIVTFCKIT